MPQARPWKVAEAFLAGVVLPKKERIRARQPVVVQSLNDRQARFVRRPENTRTQKWKRVVYVHDIRRKTRNGLFHHGIATKGPHGPESRGKEPDGAGPVQFLRPGIQLLDFVTVASQELGPKVNGTLFPAPSPPVLLLVFQHHDPFP